MTDAIPVVAATNEPTNTDTAYWVRVASEYARMDAPLRPSLQDINFFEETVAAHALLHSGPSEAMLLGATPDIAAMRWPPSFSLLGIDRSSGMLKALWPGNVPVNRWAVNADWLALPMRPSSCDIIIGDGSMNCLRSHQHQAFARSLHAALKPEGILTLRCFAQADPQERPDQVVADALRGTIPTFTQFRFRLLMALQPSAREGIAVKNVYRFWVTIESEIRSRAVWPSSDIDVIEIYRDGSAVHTFPTLAECRASFSEFFDEISVSFPTYYAGDRCPRFVLAPRRSAG